ncbi:ComEA family DNA-binding protein [Corynebacterium liangguodongii]|uniref:Competence protein ComEA n=1 Tax=Corynebacterium liangguodongii TaxID=2079535 RepID=A0A2S0WFH4_9CORY|nr:ComEA family DNA-binding protein [Corynebacterium liangguodongii]AWB84500.1 competence protein ComEA [Corynebacterium liangguodongii]PWB98718.1 ComEA family DNA-binding protein [Corynebacterium liangguodongii]
MSAIDRITELTRPTGEEDALAVTYPASRLRVEPRQATAAAVVVVALVAGWALIRPTVDSAPPEPTWPPAAQESPKQVVVSVVGEVAKPGLVTLEEGSRVADALAAAEPHPHADLIALNQAQLLVDGQQIHVLAQGSAPPALGPAPQAAGGQDGVLSLNTATAAELVELPGVGEATAAAIIAHREASGPYTSVEQLLDVKGIGPAKFEALKGLVGV